MKKKITTIQSQAIPLYLENIDTDQIYPARFLRTTSKEGLADMLFHDWRFYPDGKVKAECILNDPRYKGEILVVGKNFGCGSSREHAAWALSQYGFSVVISSSFGDIFKHNALNNQLLPIEVSEDFLEKLFTIVEKEPKTTIRISLPAQKVTISGKEMEYTFAIDPYKKECLLNGYDDFEYLRAHKKQIEAFEKRRVYDFSIND